MSSNKSLHRSVRVHLTNVVGAGASQLLLSLLPALEADLNTRIDAIYLPEKGLLRNHAPASKLTRCITYHRRLPNVLSRILECTVLGRRVNGRVPLLVLGDLPIRCDAHQTVFVQTSHLIIPKLFEWNFVAWKYRVARFIFRLNLDRVSAFIVQTKVMRDELIHSYPSIKNKIHVIPHPVPEWLLGSKRKDHDQKLFQNRNLRLFYPAAGYPHKNHSLLSHIDEEESNDWPVESLILTIDDAINPAPQISWLRCVGLLPPADMISTYEDVDALVFLSKLESLGFPLLEAMFLGLPIVCPELPYARALCGDQGIYFDPDSVESLRAALKKLKELLSDNWKPDWSEQLIDIPKTWEGVASKILGVAINPISID